VRGTKVEIQGEERGKSSGEWTSGERASQTCFLSIAEVDSRQPTVDSPGFPAWMPWSKVRFLRLAALGCATAEINIVLTQLCVQC
jgi:hypothetical protein